MRDEVVQEFVLSCDNLSSSLFFLALDDGSTHTELPPHSALTITSKCPKIGQGYAVFAVGAGQASNKLWLLYVVAVCLTAIRHQITFCGHSVSCSVNACSFNSLFDPILTINIFQNYCGILNSIFT